MKLFSLIFAICVSLAAFAQKKPLDHSVYDQWQSVKETIMHPKGQFLVYTIVPQEGDGLLYIRNIQSTTEFIIPRGSQAVFSEDGNYLFGKIKPLFSETRKAKIEKKKTEELPKDSLFIYNIVEGYLEKIANVKSFQTSTKSNGAIVYLLDKKSDLNKEGSDLFIYNLKTKFKQNIKQVSQYILNPNGQQVIVYQVPSKSGPAQVILSNIHDTTYRKLSAGIYSATGFVWDEFGTQAAYFTEKDSTSKALQKQYQLNYFKLGMDSSKVILSANNSSLPKQYVFGADKKLQFSKSGAILELGIQPIIPIKDTSLPEFERVSLDIWHYADDQLQPMQLKNLDATLKSTEKVLFRIVDNQVVYLGKITDKDIKIGNEGDGEWAYATIDSSDAASFQWQGFTKKDIYRINTFTGERLLVHKNWKGNLLSSSANGNIIIFYDEHEKKYYSIDLANNKKQIIARDIKNVLFDEENDVPDDPNAYGIAKWMNDNRHLIIYDKFDLWLVDAEGIDKSLLLTNGRNTATIYRFNETNEERRSISNNDLLLLRGFNEKNKSESLAILNMNQKQVNILDIFDMHITNIIGTKNINDLIVLKENEFHAANIYLYQLNNTQQNPLAIALLNPQQTNYNWLTTELFKWKAYTGKTVEGILYKPEDFDPTKKYPMIVYFYERNNQTLHNYIPPTPTGSRLNISFFVSRGYVVFVPDIWYKTGYPGQGAYDHIVSGTKALIQKGFVDSTKIGLQGQSWGGFQIAYLITKTNMYTAAWAGAPVVNMTSAYGGIRWGTGMNRQFQYEKTQSRIGATLWERPDLYLKNSALFELPKVQTPLVIMSNDADDAVPWYQGIEMFTAMKRLNKKVWLLVYNNEFHNLVERRNKKDIQIREQQFFDYYLKGADMPIWMSKGVPALMKGRTLGL
jgi:dienelactone hydrolase